MTIYLAVANPAGGVGKSTTAHALAVAFAEYGRRTLLVDMDSRATLTFTLGIIQPRFSLVDVLRRDARADSAIVTTDHRFTFLPSDSRLSHVDNQDKDLVKTVMRFKDELATLDVAYDYVIFDTPSNISQTLLLALELADFVIIPTNSSIISMRGALHVLDLIQASPEVGGTPTKLLGFLPCITQQNPELERLREFGSLLEPAIPRSAAVAEEALHHKSILNFAKQSSVSVAYRELAYFLLEGM